MSDLLSPKVSIIIPVYNKAIYLHESLKCICKQTMKDFEVVCIDDGSTDNSLSILQEYAHKDKRFKILKQENHGAGAARNTGIQYARGKWLYFYDADDLCSERLLEKTLSVGECDQSDIVAFNYSKFSEKSKPTECKGIKHNWLSPGMTCFNYEDCPDRIMNIINPTPWNKLYRASFIKDNELEFECIPVSNDITFCAVSAAYAGKISFVLDSLFQYRIGIAGTITSKKSNHLDSIIIAVESAIRQVQKLPYYNQIRYSIQKFSVNQFLFAYKKYITDDLTPQAEEFYNYIHEFFNSSLLKDFSKSVLGDEDDYRLYLVIKNNNYKNLCDRREREVVVSLTSYPERIHYVADTVIPIMNQTHPVQEIVLYLADNQFSDREASLPLDLQKLIKENKLTVRWCEDLKPHKKYYYAFQEYPDALIVTIDDDKVYSSKLIKWLFDTWLIYPNTVAAARTHLIRLSHDRTLLPYDQWVNNTKALVLTPSHWLMATGAGGVLYPPELFTHYLFQTDIIEKTCLNADDLWLKTMELISNVPVVLATSQVKKFNNQPGSQESALWKTNKYQNDRQLSAILAWTDETFETGWFVQKLFQPHDKSEQFDDVEYICKQRVQDLELVNIVCEISNELLAKNQELLYANKVLYHLQLIEQSKSYKIGRIILYVPKKIRDWISIMRKTNKN